MFPKKQVDPKGKSIWTGGKWMGASQDLLPAMYEDTGKQIERQRMPGQSDFTNAEKRVGRGMFTNQLVKMVTKLNPNLICEDTLAIKGCAAFYEIRYNPTTGRQEKRYTAACFRKGFIPEFTIVREDAAGLISSDTITYGWRTVVQRLIQGKCLRYRQAMEIFGEVHHDDLRGKNWALAVAPFRS